MARRINRILTRIKATMTEPRILDDEMSLEDIASFTDKGGPLLCPVCNARLVVALDLKTANKKKVHTGIYCSKDKTHVRRIIETEEARRGFLDWMDSLRQNR